MDEEPSKQGGITDDAGDAGDGVFSGGKMVAAGYGNVRGDGKAYVPEGTDGSDGYIVIGGNDCREGTGLSRQPERGLIAVFCIVVGKYDVVGVFRQVVQGKQAAVSRQPYFRDAYSGIAAEKGYFPMSEGVEVVEDSGDAGAVFGLEEMAGTVGNGVSHYDYGDAVS